MPLRSWLRIWWLTAALLLFPQLFFRCGLAVAWAMLAAGLCGLAAAFPFRAVGIRRLSFRRVLCCIGWSGGLILASALAVAVTKSLFRYLRIPFAEKQPLAAVIANSSAVEAMILFAAVCVLFPILEEVLFRRLIFRVWHQVHPPSATFGTALLFAAVHGYLPGLPGLFILGCGFQYLYLRHRNLAAAILAHSLVNMFAFGISVLIR